MPENNRYQMASSSVTALCLSALVRGSGSPLGRSAGSPVSGEVFSEETPSWLRCPDQTWKVCMIAEGFKRLVFGLMVSAG
jgi:hypothetical protein